MIAIGDKQAIRIIGFIGEYSTREILEVSLQ